MATVKELEEMVRNASKTVEFTKIDERDVLGHKELVYSLIYKTDENTVSQQTVLIIAYNYGTEKEVAYFRGRPAVLIPQTRRETYLTEEDISLEIKNRYPNILGFTIEGRGTDFAIVSAYVDDGEGNAVKKNYLVTKRRGKIEIRPMKV